MTDNLIKGLRKIYNKLIHGIAFVPAIIGIAFFILAIAAVELDSGGVGQWINFKVRWLRLKDAETARSIVSTVAAGMISLTVFTFSMVMVVMNQAASQMSNRVLGSIIGNKVQKVVLGFYIGTIFYSLFLLTTISEPTQRNSIPVLSIYILLCLTIIDIFLFIYFLHYITQSIRYEQLIKRIHDRTYTSLRALSGDTGNMDSIKDYPHKEHVLVQHSGYFQGFSSGNLLTLAERQDIVIRFLHTKGAYVLKNLPFLSVSANHKLTAEMKRNIFSTIDFYYGQEVDNNPYYGFRHLTEVAVKALSPGINDPGTAVLSLNALSDLLSHRMQHTIPDTFRDKEGVTRILTKELSFNELFNISVLPIWDYGRKDRTVQVAMNRIMNQLKQIDQENLYTHLFDKMIEAVDTERQLLYKI